MKDTRCARVAAVIEEKGEQKRGVKQSWEVKQRANYEQIKEPDVVAGSV